MLRNGFFGNLWKWYAPERKYRAENGGLSRGTYPICIHMEVPPPPPRGYPLINMLKLSIIVAPPAGKTINTLIDCMSSGWTRKNSSDWVGKR